MSVFITDKLIRQRLKKIIIFWAFFRENTRLKQTFKYSCILYSKEHTNIELLINIC